MKILTILGSPKNTGKTATVLNLAEEMLQADGHEIIRVNAAQKQIGGCLGCYACTQVNNAPGCVLQDGMHEVYTQMISADFIIISSPVYCYEMTAQIKALIDRIFALMYTSLLNKKPIAGLITCMGEEQGNADLVTETFHRMFDSSRNSAFPTTLLGTYVFAGSHLDDFESRSKAIVKNLIDDLSSHVSPYIK